MTYSPGQADTEAMKPVQNPKNVWVMGIMVKLDELITILAIKCGTFRISLSIAFLKFIEFPHSPPPLSPRLGTRNYLIYGNVFEMTTDCQRTAK